MRSVCRHSACSTRWPAWPLVAGAVALVKDREIRLDDRYGRTYLLLTLITAAVSLAICSGRRTCWQS